MALDPEPEPKSEPQPSSTEVAPRLSVSTESVTEPVNSSKSSDTVTTTPLPRRTLNTALELLRSLKPQIDSIVGAQYDVTRSLVEAEIDQGATLSVPRDEAPPAPTEIEVILDALDIMRPVKPKSASKTHHLTPASTSPLPETRPNLVPNPGSTSLPTSIPITSSLSPPTPGIQTSTSTFSAPSPPQSLSQEQEIWADHLYLAPRETHALRQVAGELVGVFDALKLLGNAAETASTTSPPSPSGLGTAGDQATSLKAPSSTLPSHYAPIAIALGPEAIVRLRGVEIWVMGSHAPDGSYVRCGGVNFGMKPESSIYNAVVGHTVRAGEGSDETQKDALHSGS
ncbi:hypothetical protein C0991_003272 [Blastosporella zonata]|nr:hypothetical protein C0991_003272 [Blastosporella zonata]